MSSNHNLLPGLPPLDDDGGQRSADDLRFSGTSQHRAMPAPVTPSTPAYPDLSDPDAYTSSRPWPPTPPAGPNAGFAPGVSGLWNGEERFTTQQHAIPNATSAFEAIVDEALAVEDPFAQTSDLLDACRAEYDRISRELDELRLLIKQSGRELEKLNQRKVLTASKTREMEERLEHYSRQDIRAAYLEASEAEMRAFMIGEQREQWLAKYRAFARYARFLQRAIEHIPVLESASATGYTGAWSVVPPAGWGGGDAMAASAVGLPALPEIQQPVWQAALTGQMPVVNPTIEIGRPGDPSAVARVIEAQEAVRQRLAQRLHDGPTQSLANVVLTAEICEKIVQSDPRHAMSELANLKGVVNAALQETRKFIFELRPMTLDDLGLVATLRRYASDIAQRYQVDVPVSAPAGEQRLPNHIEVPIFRVAQEAVMNAVEHSRATVIQLSIAQSPDGVVLTAEDNGSGFDVEPALAKARAHITMGIASMQERAELLGGWLRIESTRGRGTRVVLTVPR